MSADLLQVEGLCCGYGKTDVLRAVDFSLSQNGFVAVVGKNGCGKSTLLRALDGRIPYRGHVRVMGQEVRDCPPKTLAQKVAVLPQVRDVPHISARQLVEHGRFPYLGFPRVLRACDRAAADEAMRLTGVEAFARTDVSKLSGGERQRVYLAMCLCQSTPVLLLDEPTTYLDVRDADRMLKLLKSLSADRLVIAVLHDLDAALRTADRVLLMDGGTVAAIGTPQEVYASGAIERAYGVRSSVIRDENGAYYRFFTD